MRADLAARYVPQLMLQRLRLRFHAGLRDVVGGIAWWRRDTLLGAGVDDEPGPSAFDHVGCKRLRAVNHAPQIDRENALPVLQRTKTVAVGADAGIVHQDI